MTTNAMHEAVRRQRRLGPATHPRQHQPATDASSSSVSALPFDCPFECLPPTCDEEALKDAALASGRCHSRGAGRAMLARAKAQSVAEAGLPRRIVIGSDQICLFEGEILGKPGTKRRNILQLLRMQGKSHELLTAVSVACGEARRREHLDRTTGSRCGSLSEAQIEAYVEHDRAAGLRRRLQARARRDRAHGAGRERGSHGDCRACPLLWLGAALRRLGLAF
jgi:predicted house-cleaning NTP pyrophosphatase (Maf/HAM1 superfamily)